LEVNVATHHLPDKPVDLTDAEKVALKEVSDHHKYMHNLELDQPEDTEAQFDL
jgi:hypothetical protein